MLVESYKKGIQKDPNRISFPVSIPIGRGGVNDIDFTLGDAIPFAIKCTNAIHGHLSYSDDKTPYTICLKLTEQTGTFTKCPYVFGQMQACGIREELKPP
jgi:hypothetical protein